jgi:hypothetical protein
MYGFMVGRINGIMYITVVFPIEVILVLYLVIKTLGIIGGDKW